MNSLYSKELPKHKDNQHIINKVALQIQKDFQLYEEKIEFTGKKGTAYNELFEQVKPIIFKMLELDSVRFFSLLYAIDVDEQKVKDLLFGQKETDVSEELTHLILERELLKVVSRHLFAQQSNI